MQIYNCAMPFQFQTSPKTESTECNVNDKIMLYTHDSQFKESYWQIVIFLGEIICIVDRKEWFYQIKQI